MNFNDLTVFRLTAGAHDNPEQGVCAMEAVAWLEGLRHSDRPKCTCLVFASCVRTLNDLLPDDARQRLVAYLPRLVGTVSKKHEQERAEWLAWHAITVVTPNVLEQFGWVDRAAELRALPYHDWDTAYTACAACAVSNAHAACAAAHAAHAAAAAARNAHAACAASAAHAACAAAHAAHAAAAAARNAHAACAASAACAAAHAAHADTAVDLWQHAFDMLDGVLAIGRQSPGFGSEVAARVEAYRELVGA